MHIEKHTCEQGYSVSPESDGDFCLGSRVTLRRERASKVRFHASKLTVSLEDYSLFPREKVGFFPSRPRGKRGSCQTSHNERGGARHWPGGFDVILIDA